MKHTVLIFTLLASCCHNAPAGAPCIYNESYGNSEVNTRDDAVCNEWTDGDSTAVMEAMENEIDEYGVDCAVFWCAFGLLEGCEELVDDGPLGETRTVIKIKVTKE